MGNALTNVYNVNGDKNTITSSSDATSSLKAILDKPQVVGPAQPVVQGTGVTAALNTAVAAHVLDDSGCLITAPGSSVFHSEQDEESLDFLLSKYVFLTQVDLPYGTGAGTLLTYIPITPYPYTMTTLEPTRPAVGQTTTEWVSLLHRRYRGALVYRIKIIAPGFLAGRLQVSLLYDSNGDGSTFTASELTTSPTFMLDYNADTREFYIEVPIVTARQWLVNPMVPSVQARELNPRNSSCGTMFIYASTTAVSGGNEYNAPPVVQVYMAGFKLQFEDINPPGNMNAGVEADPFPGFATRTIVPFGSATRKLFQDDAKESSVVVLDTPVKTPPKSMPKSRVRMYPQSGRSGGGGAFGFTANTIKEVRQSRVTNTVRAGTEVPGFSLSDLATKWTLLETVRLTAADSGVIREWNTPVDLKLNLTSYAVERAVFYQTDVVIRVAPKTTMWQGGLGVLAFVPLSSSAGSYNTPTLSYLTSLSHVFVDFSSTQPVEFVIPYRTFAEYFTKRSYENQGTLVFYVQDLQFPTVGSNYLEVELLFAWENYVPIVPDLIRETTRMVPQSGPREISSYASPEEGGQSNAPIISNTSNVVDRTDTTPQMHVPADTALEGTEVSTHVANNAGGDTTSESTTHKVILANTETPKEVLKVFNYVPRNLQCKSPRHLREMAKRPVPFGNAIIRVTEPTYVSIPLWNNDTSPLALVPNGILNQLSSAYAGYAGDFVITVNVSGNADLVVLNIPNLYLEDQNDIDMLPYYAFGAVTGLSQSGNANYAASSAAHTPVECVKKDGAYVFVVPMRTQYRFMRTDRRSVQGSGQLSVPVLSFRMTEPGDYNLDIYINISDDGRFGVWRGTPEWFFPHILDSNAPATEIIPPDTIFAES